MEIEEFEKHKGFAGDKKGSMHRRRIGHDYGSRCLYFVTLTVKGREPVLGRLVGKPEAPDGTLEAPRVVLSDLGKAVKECWWGIKTHYPGVEAKSLMVMPDHMHGIIFMEGESGVQLGTVIRGFKIGCNKAYWKWKQSSMQQQGCCLTTAPLPVLKEGDYQLWDSGYNDIVLTGKGTLAHWFTYIQDNPRRLAFKRAYPDYFRVRFGLSIANQSYAAIGNRFLLDFPMKEVVQCSRSMTDAEIQGFLRQMMEKARSGSVLVSPAISKGEQAVMRAALDAGLPLIFLSPWGFNSFSKPGHQYFNACAAGRLLILAPWEHQNQRIPLTREMCLELNKMAAEICGRMIGIEA